MKYTLLAIAMSLAAAIFGFALKNRVAPIRAIYGLSLDKCATPLDPTGTLDSTCVLKKEIHTAKALRFAEFCPTGYKLIRGWCYPLTAWHPEWSGTFERVMESEPSAVYFPSSTYTLTSPIKITGRPR